MRCPAHLQHQEWRQGQSDDSADREEGREDGKAQNDGREEESFGERVRQKR